MEIVIQSHHATVSERTRLRAVHGLEKLAQRMARPGAGVVRFEEDGRLRRVELILQLRGRQLVAEGMARSGRRWRPPSLTWKRKPVARAARRSRVPVPCAPDRPPAGRPRGGNR